VNDRHPNRLPWALLVIMCVICVFLAARLMMLELNVAFADGHIATLEAMKVSANGTPDPQILTAKLRYVLAYYHTNSKQAMTPTGIKLDRILETARSNAIAGIIARLRTATGKDLGSDPQIWLRTYPPGE